MNAKEILAKVKALFSEPVEPVTDSKVYKLQDGTEISITLAGADIAVGDMVTVGGVLPVAGEMVLEDGTTIVVDAMGAITEIKPAAPVTTDLSQEPLIPTLEERISAIESALKNINQPSIPTGMATEVQLQQAFAKAEKQDKVIEGLFELVEKILEEPATDPKTLPESKREGFKAKKEERLERFASALKKTKTGNHQY